MRLLLLFFVLGLTGYSVLAQEKPKATKELSLRAFVDQISSNKIDSLSLSIEPHIDSLNSIGKGKADSLKSPANKPQVKENTLIKSREGHITQPVDSLHKAAHSIQTKTTYQAQKRLGNLEEKISDPADNLQQKLNATSQALQNKTVDPLQQGVEGAAQKLTSHAEDVQKKLNTGIGSVQSTISSPMDSLRQGLNLNTLPSGDLKLPGSQGITSIPALPGLQNTTLPNLGTEVKIPLNTDVSGVVPNLPEGTPNSSLPNTEVKIQGEPGVNTTIPFASPGIQGATLPNLNPDLKIPGQKEMGRVTEGLQSVNGNIAKASEIGSEAAKLKEGKLDELKTLPGEAENALNGMEAVKGIDKDVAKLTEQQQQYMALIEKYKDKKRLQEEIKAKSALVVNDLLQKNMPVVLETQKNMSKAKRMYGSFQSIKNLPLKRPNEMKDKPFRERIMPGLFLQIYQADHLVIDFAPSLAYRFTGRLTAGFNYSFRLGFNEDFQNYVRNEQVSGPRVFSQFLVMKGFFVHGDLEAMQARNAALTGTQEGGQTVLASYVGIGKNFGVSRRFKGSVLGLYRFEYSGTLPGHNPFNLRIGFSYDTRKIRRSGK